MHLRAFSATHLGKVKDENEDRYHSAPTQGLFLLADGMGGQSAGEVASQMAIDIVVSCLGPRLEELRTLAAIDTPEGRKQILSELEQAVRRADQEIYARSQAEPEKRGMASTVDVLFLGPGGAYIAHVGDSRIYLLRHEQAYLLTTDHTLANHLYAQGKLSAEEIEKIPHRHSLMRALGMTGSAVVETLHLDMLRADRFMLCSDGLSHYLRTHQDLLNMIQPGLTQATADELISFANSNGGRDNATVLIVEVEDPGLSRKNLETTQKIKLLQKIALFRELTHQEMLQILSLTHEYSLDAGEIVIREGEPGGELFVLLDGGVDVESGGVLLTSLQPGNHFGELALVDDRPRSATVRTNSTSRLLVLRRKDFHQLTRGELAPKLLWNLIFDISNRLRQTSWQLTEQVRAFPFTLPPEDDTTEHSDSES